MAGRINERSIFFASFMTLIAAGVGFIIRNTVLDDWAAQFGFTKSDLGKITGGGLTGFGITIIACSLIADRIGYRALLIIAFLLHVSSAVVTLAATPVFQSTGSKAYVYNCLFYGSFLFALGNGVCESAINPLVATLFPKQKTHYLNILHAGWPGGLILGAILAYFFCGNDAKAVHLQWEIPMAFFLVPTLWYGFITLKESFPISEARAAGVNFGEMLAQFAAPMLILLLFLHACVGYVELGTDSWITNIMKNAIGGDSVLLFIYTSAIMFVLRFFAGPIVHRINPLGLLFMSGCLGCIGLYALGSSTTLTMIIAAATIYGLGKTFLWPTMLGVVGELFPKGGALVMGAMGGVGMLSAGLLGGPGIGYEQDYYASGSLKEKSLPTYERYVSDEHNSFLMFPPISGLDGSKVGVLMDDGKDLDRRLELAKADNKTPDKETVALEQWWQSAEQYRSTDKPEVDAANLFGGQMALKWTALVPLTMAVGYLLLVLYFLATGGYKAVHLDEEPEGPAEY